MSAHEDSGADERSGSRSGSDPGERSDPGSGSNPGSDPGSGAGERSGFDPGTASRLEAATGTRPVAATGPGGTTPPPARRSSARGALTLMIGTLGSRVTGLLRNSLLNALFSSHVSDAFVTAFKVPNLFRELLAEGALTNSFIPVYTALEPAERRRMSGALLGLLAVVNGVLLILAYVAAPLVARLLISDPANVDVALTTQLVRIVFPFLPAISLSALAMGILNSEERFLAPAWAPVALNVVTVTLMAVFPGQAVMLALAHVLGGVAQLIVQVPALLRNGLLPRLSGLWHPALGGVVVLMIPFAFTSGGRQVLNVVTSNIVTGIAQGAATAFYNADLFLSLALGLFSISPALAYYARLADDAVRAPEAFNTTLAAGLRFITFLTVPAGLALAIMAVPAVQVVFNWSSLVGPGLDDARLRLSIAATAPLGLAVFPIGVFNLLVRTFYVRRRVVTPVVVVLVFLTLQGILYALLAARLGIAGVSWGAVIASWAQLLVMLLLVYRRERFDLRGFLGHAGAVWLAALMATGAAMVALRFVPLPSSWTGHVLRLLLGGGVLALVYAAAGATLRLPELAQVARRLRRR